MKHIAIIFISLICCLELSGQKVNQKEVSAIITEGKQLYKSEMASWYGTDLFIEKYANRKAQIGGYFSYEAGDSVRCVFYSNDESPSILGTISFDKTYNTKTALINGEKRTLSSTELDLYTIRQAALNEIKRDTFFKHYKNSNLNLIPLITNNEKRVYVLTGPTGNNTLIFGNDYIITFDKNNKIKNKKEIHKNILIQDIKNSAIDNESTKMVAGFHNHLNSTGNYITSTDVCTIMLYEKIFKLENYYVFSDKFVSIWDCKKDDLAVMTRKRFEKISKDSK